MPKGARKSRRSGRKGHNANPVDGRTTTAYVRFLANYATAASGSNQFTLGLHPLNFGTRAVEFCDLFEEYRWLSVKASYLAAYSTATTNAVTSIVGLSASEALSSVPTTAIQIAQYDTAHVTFLNQTTPIQINLARELLRGHQEWYSANVGADVPAVFSAAGMSISTGLAVAGNITILWEAKIQFKGNSDPAVTLYRKARRSVDPTHDIDKIVTSNLSKRFGVIAVE